MNIRVCRDGEILYVPIQECIEVEIRAFCHEFHPDSICDVLISLLYQMRQFNGY